MTRRLCSFIALFFATVSWPCLSLLAQAPPQQPTAKSAPAKGAVDALTQIKDEGLKKSQVMQTLSYLTDVIGPRLTASPNMKRANTWTRDKLYEWGLKDAHLEAWGPFGRGWTLKSFSAQVVEPQCIPLIAYPKAWSPGTNGPIVGNVVFFDAKNEKDLENYKGKLKGAIVLTNPVREVRAHFESLGHRLDEKDLLGLADASEPPARAARRMFFQQRRPNRPMTPNPAIDFFRKRTQFLIDEGVAMIADPSFAGDGGTLFVMSATVPSSFPPQPGRRMTPWDKQPPKIVPQMVVASEHYNRLVRMLQQGEKLKMEVELDVQFPSDDLMGYNTVAEIPGTDLKDEIVMLGGHMDSWHGGTGATDNGAGVSVGMEAVRIIQTLNLKPRRTIRIALWSGEEQGLFGSRAYVKEHFGNFDDDPTSVAISIYNAVMRGESPARQLIRKPDYDKLSAYFNLDNGTGKIRGVYLEGNEGVRPIFRRWLQPFRTMGAATLSISPTFGTDHESFDGIGLPGFQFIQDPVEYETRTHHSNQDVYDRAQADDLKQAAVIMASFVYNTAMMDEKLPRKPRPDR